MQVLRVKLGRKRRNGKRHPSGQLVVEKISREWCAKQMPHRRGLPESVIADERGATVFGRMRLHTIDCRDRKCKQIHITDPQFTAGERWQRVVGSYLATIGPPRALAGRGYGRDISEEEAERRKRECFEGIEAIKVAGGEAIRAINRVVLEDCDCPLHWETPLVWGLVELVKHFGLTGNRGQGGKVLVFQAPEQPPIDNA